MLPTSCFVMAQPTNQASQANQAKEPYFNRVATFEAQRNVPAGRNASKKSVAEIVAASEDGRTLAYTDGEQQGIGLIDIADPANPKPAGFIAVEGEPTSVVVSRGKVLAVVNSSEQFFQPEGHLAVIDLKTKNIVMKCNLQGQPDAITLDKNARHAVIAMENERDEKLNKGAMPQLPAGNVLIVPISNYSAPN